MTTHHHLFSIRLPGRQRWATYLGLIALAGSGIAWTVLHDLLHLGWMLAEHRLLVLHGVAAAVSLVVVGGLLPLHVRLAWRVRRNLWSGVVTMATMSALAVTGLLLYYGTEEFRDWTRWTHIGVGLAGSLLIPMHVWLGRRRNSKQAGQMAEPAARADVQRFTT